MRSPCAAQPGAKRGMWGGVETETTEEGDSAAEGSGMGLLGMDDLKAGGQTNTAATGELEDGRQSRDTPAGRATAHTSRKRVESSSADDGSRRKRSTKAGRQKQVQRGGHIH